jgi:hypothetical protein
MEIQTNVWNLFGRTVEALQYLLPCNINNAQHRSMLLPTEPAAHKLLPIPDILQVRRAQQDTALKLVCAVSRLFRE